MFFKLMRRESTAKLLNRYAVKRFVAKCLVAKRLLRSPGGSSCTLSPKQLRCPWDRDEHYHILSFNNTLNMFLNILFFLSQGMRQPGILTRQ